MPSVLRISIYLMFLLPGSALASGNHDPIAPIILGVTGILFFAIIGRYLARLSGQPSILGELTMGLIVGNLGYFFGNELALVLREGALIFDFEAYLLHGMPAEKAAQSAFGHESPSLIPVLTGEHGVALLQIAHAVDLFSRYGIIFLLFLVGLETNWNELKRVGGDSFRVAVLGAFLPFLCGFWMARLLMPSLSVEVDLFVAATLGATSAGVTAAVLKEMGRTNSSEGHIILGAAVIDDILGLVTLAVISGIVASGTISLTEIGKTVAMAGLFLGGAFLLWPYVIRAMVGLLRRLELEEAKLFISFLFVMVLAWLANLVGLATIIGAFVAGVILHEGYFHYWGEPTDHRFTIRDLIAPLETVLVPIFFVLMGIQVKLETLTEPKVAMLTGGLIVAAVVGKWLCGLGARRGFNRLAIGLGMVPRGEVGLIFASLGKNLGVISDTLFSAVVLMVMATTLMTPPLLKWALNRKSRTLAD